MNIKKNEIIEIHVTDIAFGGKGISKKDGFTIFVDNAIPDDIVNVKIIKVKKNYAESKIIDIISPSPFRIKPPCQYNDYCGGCKWQFLEYEKQLEYKQKHVEDSLVHIGMLKDIKVHTVHPSPLKFGYRNKMEFSCSDKRWIMPSEMGQENIDSSFAIGLHAPLLFDKVIDIDLCLLQQDVGNDILVTAKDFIKKSKIPLYGIKSHTGFWRFLMLRHSFKENAWMINIITSKEDKQIVQSFAEELTKSYKEITSIINNVTSRKSSVAIGEYELSIFGKNHISESILGFEFEISANSFFQTNTYGAEILYGIVRDFVGDCKGKTILDIYTGTGTIPIILSPYADKIAGIEIVPEAVKDAEKNCRNNKVDNCEFILGDVKDAIAKIEKKPEVVIIDPPRVGMHKDVVKQIITMAPEKIVYVSCNPATMARDLAMMKDFYNVIEVKPVDMFPHTYHIESVAKLGKR
ncbi:MAG: 23S rRNA (uracil(1939)-C(5))-methyltransferase RlmD [Desulfobacterales bacterium]|nr:23S rRNA (uracil(1939)-C(5))-methyltransferase RlmD [Desulfobacterales bacterium]